MNSEKQISDIVNNNNKNDGEHRLSFFARLRGYLFAGVLVTAPISITVYLTWVFIQFMDSLVVKSLPEKYNPDTYLPFTLPGLGLLAILTVLILIGWFATNFLGRLIFKMSDYIVHQVPVIRNLYGAIKQIFETIMASQSQAFRDVVMLEYPRREVWSIGFVTGTSKGQIQKLTDSETINVFVPTTPNPTSGYLLFVPKKEIHFLDMTVEEGIKLVVSAGIITPPDPHDYLAGGAEDNAAQGKGSKAKDSDPEKKTPEKNTNEDKPEKDQG